MSSGCPVRRPARRRDPGPTFKLNSLAPIFSRSSAAQEGGEKGLSAVHQMAQPPLQSRPLGKCDGLTDAFCFNQDARAG